MSVTDPAIATVLHDSEAETATSPLRHAVLMGLLFGVIGVYLSAIGLLLMLHERATQRCWRSASAPGSRRRAAPRRWAPAWCAASWPAPSPARWWRCCRC
jgi:hypothetical protein